MRRSRKAKCKARAGYKYKAKDWLISGFSSPWKKVDLDIAHHIRCSVLSSVLREGRAFTPNRKCPTRARRGSSICEAHAIDILLGRNVEIGMKGM